MQSGCEQYDGKECEKYYTTYKGGHFCVYRDSENVCKPMTPCILPPTPAPTPAPPTPPTPPVPTLRQNGTIGHKGECIGRHDYA